MSDRSANANPSRGEAEIVNGISKMTDTGHRGDPDHRTRQTIILTINYALAIVFVLGSIFVMASALFSSRPIPEIIQHVVAITVGYFGGALTSFVESRSSDS